MENNRPPDDPHQKFSPPPFDNKKKKWRNIILLILLAVLFQYLMVRHYSTQQINRIGIPYTLFKQELREGNIEKLSIEGREIRGSFLTSVTTEKEMEKFFGSEEQEVEVEQFKTLLPPFEDKDLMSTIEERGIELEIREDQDSIFWQLLFSFLPWLFIIGFIIFMGRRVQSQQRSIFNVGSSRAKYYVKKKTSVTFSDVAGLEGAKMELEEIVEFLKDPDKFKKIGAKIPKGILLVGPPGTGKTLLARAIAGEADVPYFSISGSEFVEMFVGVGAARVRDLFQKAKKSAPTILFVDEIDAVGRARGTGLGGGHDEREQTLNQLLNEMDGFQPNEDVVVIAATNRPDVLDPALLRPGRFDRHITVETPSLNARVEILKVHCRNKPIAEQVDLRSIARSTPGVSGAQLENLVNEAALFATRKNKTMIEMEDFEDALDRIFMGLKRTDLISENEKKIIALHEAGHALAALLLPNADPLHKVTIIPHGMALGVTQQLPIEDKHNYNSSYLADKIATLLAGRAAEKMIFGEVSTGAESDLKQASKMARNMVTRWGMSDKLGPVYYEGNEEHVFLGKEIAGEKHFSEQTAAAIDEEIKRIISEQEASIKKLLEENKEALERLSKELIEKETMSVAQVQDILKETQDKETAKEKA